MSLQLISEGEDNCQDEYYLKMLGENELQRRCTAIRGRYEVASYWLVPESCSSRVLGSLAVASARKIQVNASLGPKLTVDNLLLAI